MKVKTYIVVILCLAAVILTWQIKYRANYNYLDSNATWHVLFTVQAYDETPVSVHKFLPIVSFGDELDKDIQWAEMVSDGEGNYYYTSFSPAGFVLPYFFFKVFHMSVTEYSLYLFNLLLCCLTVLLCMKLFCDMFREQLREEYICVLVTLLFAFQTEIMQGMGQVYWHQSLMQVLLAAQFLNFYHFKEKKIWKIAFFILCFLMPYVEWTGCIANVGFAIALFFGSGIHIKVRNILWVFLSGLCTVGSLGVLVLHYLSVIEWGTFRQALQDRFMMRTRYAYASTFQLIWGYWKSFKTLWIILIVLFITCCIINKGFKWLKQWHFILPMAFVMLFPLLENLVMKEHAISYTYDRMKLVYPLMLLAFICIVSLCMAWHDGGRSNWIPITISMILLGVSVYNVHTYVNNTELLWSADYRGQNEEIAAYCIENYHENSVYGMNGAAVRGYMNMLFHRGIYENATEEELIELAKERGARYAVLITPASEPSPDNCWGMYAIDYVTVIDMNTGTEEIVQK
jgi:hypothetical protein